MSLIIKEQQQRFQEYVDRIGRNGLSLSCLTSDEREEMVKYIDLWLADQELVEIGLT